MVVCAVCGEPAFASISLISGNLQGNSANFAACPQHQPAFRHNFGTLGANSLPKRTGFSKYGSANCFQRIRDILNCLFEFFSLPGWQKADVVICNFCRRCRATIDSLSTYLSFILHLFEIITLVTTNHLLSLCCIWTFVWPERITGS